MSSRDIIPHMERRKRKQEIRKLLQVGHDEENDNEVEIDFIESTIQTADELVHGQRQLATDSTADVLLETRVLRVTHDMAGAAIRGAQGEFNEDEFAAMLLRRTNDGECWDVIYEAVTTHFRTVTAKSSIYDELPKERPAGEVLEHASRKQREKRQRNKDDAAVARPENVTQRTKLEAGAQNVKALTEQIKEICEERDGKVLYYELVTDPNSFRNTIDNIMEVCFLVRDSKLLIYEDDVDGELYAELTNQAYQEKINDRPAVQAILTIDHCRWTSIIEKYNLKEPILNLKQ